MQTSKFDLDHQRLDLGIRALEQLHPGAQITYDAGPHKMDLCAHDSGNDYYYDMKFRPANYGDIALEYASLFDDGSLMKGWVFKPEWNILYMNGDGYYFVWDSKELLANLLSKPVFLNKHFASPKGNLNYRTLCFSLRPPIMQRFLHSFKEGQI